MNLDFHYYATYLAAFTAGFSKEEAKTIAYAAQFVDECITNIMPKNGPAGQVQTCRDMEEVVKEGESPYPYTADDVKKAEQIWSYFHFLPGNFEGKQPYNGKITDSTFGVTWDFNGSAKDDYKLMCLPESELAKAIIDDIKNNHKGSDNLLPLIGLRMHVLADTWAHAYFAGLPEWCINDVKQTKGIQEFYDKNWVAITAKQAFSDKTQDSPENHIYNVVRLTSPRYISPYYLGHGQLGHMPDYGFLRYKYHPVWKSQLEGECAWQEKDNTDFFMKAFIQMVAAMKAIREGKEFPKEVDMNDIDQTLKSEISAVLSNRKIDQSEYWNNLINTRTGSKLEDFNKYLWTTECSNSNTPKQTNYYKFANAAISQYKFVEKFIENKIPARSAKPFNIIGDRSDKGSLENGVLKVGMPLQVIRNGQTVDFCSGIIPGIEWIKLVYEKFGVYEFKIIVRGGCIKGKWSNDLYFTDKTGDHYSLSIVDSRVKEHTVRYYSTDSDIVKVTWNI